MHICEITAQPTACTRTHQYSLPLPLLQQRGHSFHCSRTCSSVPIPQCISPTDHQQSQLNQYANPVPSALIPPGSPEPVYAKSGCELLIGEDGHWRGYKEPWEDPLPPPTATLPHGEGDWRSVGTRRHRGMIKACARVKMCFWEVG